MSTKKRKLNPVELDFDTMSEVASFVTIRQLLNLGTVNQAWAAVTQKRRLIEIEKTRLKHKVSVGLLKFQFYCIYELLVIIFALEHTENRTLDRFSPRDRLRGVGFMKFIANTVKSRIAQRLSSFNQQ